MNTTTSNTKQAEIKAIEIVYQVSGLRHGEQRVSVTPRGEYECRCGSHTLYGSCIHTDAVKAQRKNEGRKF